MTMLYNEGGYTIALTDRKRFELKGPEFDGQEFDSYTEALDKLEKLRGAAAKRIKKNLALPALFVSLDTRARGKVYKIEEVVLTGLHASRGLPTSKPAVEQSAYGRADFYPNVPIVRAILKEEARLERELEAVKKKLRAVEIEGPGYNIKEMDYEEALTAFQKRHAEATAKAEAMAISEAEIVETPSISHREADELGCKGI